MRGAEKVEKEIRGGSKYGRANARLLFVSAFGTTEAEPVTRLPLITAEI
jgi:hypothetical protein